MFVIKKAVRAAGAGVGLAAEAIDDRKQKKKLTPGSSPSRGVSVHNGDNTPSGPSTGQANEKRNHEDDSDTDSSVEGDEEIWELDEAVDPPSYEETIKGDIKTASNHPDLKADINSAPSYSESEATSSRDIPSGEADLARQKSDSDVEKANKRTRKIDALVAMCPPPPVRVQDEFGQLLGPLPCPVVLPQRRPHQKSRGFVRAYAPVLYEAGIPQEAWIGFLNDWDESSKASPWIDVVFLAANIAGFVPDPIAMAVTTAVAFAAGTARELQMRHRSNTFLGEMNEKLFKPRGLFALVMAFKPESNTKNAIEVKPMNLVDTISKYDSTPKEDSTFSMASMAGGLKSIRVQSGVTKHEFEMPEAAALIFPKLDHALDEEIAHAENDKDPNSLATRMKTRFKGANSFVADYADRRAQAAYQYEQPNSSLAKAMPQPNFASKLADPKHPMFKGGIIQMLTGGHYSPTQRKARRRVAKRERKNERRIARGKAPRQNRYIADGAGDLVRRKKKKPGIISKVLKQVTPPI